MNKIAILKDNKNDPEKTKKIARFAKALSKQFVITSPDKADYLIVLGGDGLMIRLTKKYCKLQKPFYGINCGSIGFTLNDHSAKDDFTAAIHNAMFTDFPLIESTIKLESGAIKKAFAFNEIYTKTISAQSAKHAIKINGQNILGKNLYCGDGIIVCTPGGTTAYNHAAGGIILNNETRCMGLTPVSPFRPIGLKPQVLSGDSIVEIEMIENEKRRHIVVADNVAFRNVKKVTIKLSDNKIKIGFKHNNSFFQKTLKLRFPWS